MKAKVIKGPGLLGHVTIGENQLVELKDSHKGWCLARGHADLVLTVENGNLPPRHYRLLEITAGQLFFFFQPCLAGYSIALFTRSESEVTCPGLVAQLLNDAKHSFAAEQWLERLQGLVSARCPPTASPPIVFPLIEEVDIQSRMWFSAKFPADSDPSGWVNIRRGEVCLFNNSQTTVRVTNLNDHNEIWLPVDETFWFTVMQDAKVTILKTKEVPAEGRILGIRWLFRALALMQREMDIQTEPAGKTSITLNNQKLEKVHARLGALVGREPSGSHDSGQSSPLRFALHELELHGGGPFLFPSAFDESAPLELQLEAIAYHSGTQVRKIQLPSDWQEKDYQDLLVITRDEQIPIAALHEPATAAGSEYELRLPVNLQKNDVEIIQGVAAEKARKSSRVEVPELAPIAYLFTMPLVKTSKGHFFGFLKKLVLRYRTDLYRIGFLSLLGIGMSVFIPLISATLLNEIIPDGAHERLHYLAGMFFGIVLITAGLNYLKSVYMLRIQTLLGWRIQEAVMNRLLQLPVKFINRYSSGDLQNRLLLISSIASDLYAAVFSMLMKVILLITFLSICYLVLPQLGWIALATITAFITLAAIQVYLSRRPSIELEEREGRILGFSHQMIGGLPQIRQANAERRAYRAWCEQFSEVVVRQRKLLLVSDIGDVASPVITHTSNVMVMAAAGTIILNSGGQSDGINLGSYFAFYFAFQSLVSVGEDISNNLSDFAILWFQRALVLPILNSPVEKSESRVESEKLTGKIDLNDVSFHYEGGPPVLQNINMSVRAGQFVAIVGPSGAGKSTLLRLLIGFDTPTEGSVLFDDNDLLNLDLQSVRRQLGVVLQNSTVPAGTIAEIISGNTPLTLDKLWGAAVDANLAEDIDAMPMNMHTIFNHGAPTLSGGQRQRLLIARAIAANRRLLLLDESTSALDNVSQRVVAENLRRYRVTRIVVAHRLSTIRNADWIYVMDKGCIVQQGNFDTLYDADGLFRELALLQFAESKENVQSDGPG